jgi:uncharacterized membrane protein YqjE
MNVTDKDKDKDIDDGWVVPVRGIGRGELAFFSGLKWLLVCAWLGVIIAFFYPSQSLAQVSLVLCALYILGSVYRFIRLRAARKTVEVEA